ncbi:hypothetical protein FH972_006918 [Carpinus fangiana]|uniref:Uncharacterized protein n=1 Tax=Carpinus fangiana TaxID=176857 RepID=A0A5N6QWP7_9ROSI|nr:hypothetical protein FH972_006918 [Carpinus fangiana]
MLEANGLVALGKLVQKQGKSTDICHFGLRNVSPHSSPLTGKGALPVITPILCPSIPENPNISHLRSPRYDAVSRHSHVPDSPPSPVVSDHEPFPQLDGHSVPEETAHRKASPQKSQLETPRIHRKNWFASGGCDLGFPAKIGPYAWVQYTPGERIPPTSPNEGSVKGRNERKRMRQRRAFILAEKKKRQAQLREANRKKIIKRVERKMAAVARDREWAQRLAELQQLEEEKKKSTA